MSELCCGRIYTGSYSIYSHACGKKAKVVRDGQHYCGLHDPVAKQEKRDAATAERRTTWAAEAASNKAKADAMAEQKRRADCYDDLLDALKQIYNHHSPRTMALARKALAKATKETT